MAAITAVSLEVSEPEVRKKPRPQLLWVLAVLVALVLITAGLVRLLIHAGDRDPRPRGTLEDLLALRERSDLNVLFVLVDTLRADRLGVCTSSELLRLLKLLTDARSHHQQNYCVQQRALHRAFSPSVPQSKGRLALW